MPEPVDSINLNNLIAITIYFVGENEEDASGSLPFDSYESAWSFQLDNPGTRIFSAPAIVVLSEIEEVDE